MKTEKEKMISGEPYRAFDVLAAGNPCRVLKEITERDKLFYFKNLKLEEI